MSGTAIRNGGASLVAKGYCKKERGAHSERALLRCKVGRGNP